MQPGHPPPPIIEVWRHPICAADHLAPARLAQPEYANFATRIANLVTQIA